MPWSSQNSEAGILRRYARLALGGATASVAAFESAEASLVYTAPDIFLDPATDPIAGRIDLNGDGTPEVGVVVGSASVADENGNIGMVHGGGLDGAFIAFSGIYPLALEASDYVGSSLSFRRGIGTLAFSSAGFLGSRGEWFSGRDAYLGARFLMGEQYFYGWLHAVWDPKTSTMRIDLAAYEDSGAAAHIEEQKALPDHFSITIEPTSDPTAGQMALSWPVLAGRTYELQRSTDLEDWETIHVIVPYRDGVESFVDDGYAESPKSKSFYRVGQRGSCLMLLALGIPRRRRRGSEEAG